MTLRIAVDCAATAARLEHFWRSTGFTPARLLLGDDMRQTLAWVGSMPHGAITHVRMHYLLDLVKGSGFGTERPAYDWSDLDNGLDVLRQNGLKPFFELMGNPSGWFSDFSDDAQLYGWKQLVRDLALHLMGRYGTEEVRTWYFESWNEPDCGGWWPQWPDDEATFCNYYDACSEGLREADRGLRLGGPGTCATLSSLFKSFIAHCDTGANYFTGKKGVRLDFISIHEKGVRSSAEDLNPDTRGILLREGRIIGHIRANHPRLADVPFMNNECDPQVGWWDIHTWRARPFCAAIVAKVITQHQVLLAEDPEVNYGLLSNDNGFLGTWGNRTLLTRFGSEEELAEGRFELIKKPVLNAMALLAMLGDTRVPVQGAGDVLDEVGVLATRRGEGQVAVLLYHSRDRITSSGCEWVELALQNLPSDNLMLVHYRIDEDGGDPFRVWEEMGAPPRPNAEQYAAMRAVQEIDVFDGPREVRVPDGRLELEFDLPLPSVSLILLSARPPGPPGPPVGLRADVYPGLCDGRQVMLTWRGPESRVIGTYEVLHAPSPEGAFRRINEVDLLCRAFLHTGEAARAAGCYKVRAVDYWGRAGEASEAVTL